MRKKAAAALPRLPPDARAKSLAHAEAAISTNGLTHLVIGVYVLISAAVWWFGAYKEFHFGHGPNGEDVWQRWPIAYVFLLFLVCLAKLVHALGNDTVEEGGHRWRWAWTWVGGIVCCDYFQASGGWDGGMARYSPLYLMGMSGLTVSPSFITPLLLCMCLPVGFVLPPERAPRFYPYTGLLGALASRSISTRSSSSCWHAASCSPG